MASTYVKVTSLEDARKYFDAGLLYWWSAVIWAWRPQNEVTNGTPPAEYEVRDGYWGILVEDEGA